MADNSLAATVREAMSSSGLSRYQLSQRTGIAQAVLGRFFAGKRDITLFTASRLFEAIGLTLARVSDNRAQVGETPDGLAELKNDRDKWQTRAKQAEGRVATLTQDLIKADEQVNELQQQLTVATADRNTFRADANRARDQLEIARQQLQDRDAADQVPGNEQLRQQVTQLIAEREGLTQQLQQYEQQNIKLTKDLEGLRFQMRHSEQQRMILAETSQDQLGQIRMAERFASLMCDKIAQLAVERG